MEPRLTGTGPAAQTAENLRQVVEDLAATVPCYRLPVGADPAALAARISELLAPIPPVPTRDRQHDQEHPCP